MIYVTGDCHGNFARFEQKNFPEQANMTKDDTVIITGDCGGVWFGDSRDDETPVSYTHLDVYKRQVSACSAFTTISPSGFFS